MRYSKELNQASKITLMFTVTTGLFALLEKICTIIHRVSSLSGKNGTPFPSIEGNLVKYHIENFFKDNILWFVVVIFIILGLCIYIKKSDGRFNLNFIHRPEIRLTSGFLIILDGILKLSNIVSILVLYIQAVNQSAALSGGKADGVIRTVLISDGITILANLLQILLGLYFIIHNRKIKEL